MIYNFTSYHWLKRFFQFSLSLVLYLNPFYSSGQSSLLEETKIDSLKQVITTAEHDTIKINAWKQWARLISRKDPKYNEELLNKVVKLCEDNSNDKESELSKTELLFYQNRLAEASARIGLLYNYRDYDKALGYLSRSLKIYEEIESEPGIARTLNRIAKVYIYQARYDEAIDYLKRSVKMYEETGEKRGLGSGLALISVVHSYKGDHAQAIDYAERCLKVYREIEYKEGIASALGNLGRFYEFQGNYIKAIDYAIQCHKIFEELGYKEGIAATLGNIAGIYVVQENYDKAMTYFNRSLALNEELDHKAGSADVLLGIGDIYFSQGDYDKAMEKYMQSLKIVEEIKEKGGIASSLSSIGAAHLQQKDYNEALIILMRSLEIFEELAERRESAIVLSNLSKVFIGQGKYDKAIEYGQRSLKLGKEENSLQIINQAAYSLYKSYKGKNKSKLALQMHETYTAALDSLESEENQRAVIRHEYKYEYEKQALADSLQAVDAQKVSDAQLMAKEAQILQQRQQAIFIGFGLLSLLLLSGFVFYRRRNDLQKQLALEQEEAQRLKELDQFKSKLYTNLTHEFRTPLTVILGMAKKVKKEPTQFLDEGTKLIERNGKNLLRIINQLLDLSKMENHSFQLQLVQADIIIYLQYLTESFDSYANAKNLSIRFFSNSETLMMDFDVEQIKQVMTNLISNAIKFTPSGGEVRVRVLKESNDLQIEVIDDGIGIPEEAIPYIFDRFYQVDDSSTRGYEGTGIGLAHTKEIIRLMDGDVTVKSIHENSSSEAQSGSTFTIHLPIRCEAPMANATSVEDLELTISTAPEAIAPTTKSKTNELPTILLVEDNSDVVVYLKSCLENDYQIEVAKNGNVGIEKAIEAIPDLIISDVMMPGKDGFEVCDILKKDERTSHIPIMLLTARADMSSKLAGLERGADAYLAKPFNEEELSMRIQNLLSGRQKMREYFSKQYLESTEGLPIPILENDPQGLQIENTFIKKLNLILEENMHDENFGLVELRQKAGMSRSQFFRKMKALTGIAPSEYFRTYRLKKSKYLLEETDSNVADAAYAVGFKDPSYFAKLFQEAFGTTPSTLKNKRNQNK